MWSNTDIAMMSRAIMLARRGRYTTRPNPNVGCVIIDADGKIVGEGWHQRAGEPHAEVHALKMAADKARGATAYVTLEPCSHYGRTPPCAEALIKHGLKRVVVAMTDPNPQVAGRGIGMLQAAGIQVQSGLLAEQARALNPGFLSRMERNRPWVTLKLAASLDGKTALANGESKWITGPEARRDVQRLRARSCALLTGIETVLADDPSLNVRHAELGSLGETLSEQELIQPLRVILDSNCRMPLDARLLKIVSPVLLVSCRPYEDEFLAALPPYVTTLVLAGEDNRVDIAALLQHLNQSCNAVLVEAGATLCGAFISAGLADELLLYQAPKLLGAAGRNLLALPNYQQIADTPAIRVTDQRKLGNDTRLTLKIGD
ncbi:bifunctional diaminohydroxyphosphoribosylaminopyrimidine deaminase/5-amino-6-(5-phosphoribosylamino)uracil reductase RibD [Shewanella chilikensis]|uniref:bifunctional diaminohydroxyphosphoribosylaminopyrimidine deaminase/5-amino-6-(5-phosphoribosylamino)uracil reductase RibD n=1 Tax=Shewanella TaxID=22 RepID=UPI001CD27FE4|nr:bifunctional diaminohydroxyphosphoribosylaminopyrimidine deaminase/5-amino-6-(5-phosphoribosylamino)uracil reductase RibD [Shewanella chilikensis]MCA0951134.1 bifunctional diaminohydroxyphosphoribosylaminopyrimidine deaminase/5-amino-6-(5-phosphoribosylamino)uracil reductase RibD [Shewanella chilikensis]